MEDSILAYAAGLVDGEGTVVLTKHKSKFRSPHVSVASTTRELLEWLLLNFGGLISSKKVYKPHHKKSYAWCVHYDTAVGFLTLVAPFMKEPEKVRRAQLILQGYKGVTKRNGKYTQEELAAKLNFEDQFFHPSTT